MKRCTRVHYITEIICSVLRHDTFECLSNECKLAGESASECQNILLKANSERTIYAQPTPAEIRRSPLTTLLCRGFIEATCARFNEPIVHFWPFDM